MRTAILLCLASLATSTARAQFAEPGVTVLRTFSGDAPGELFGAVIAELADIDDDGVTDVVIAATRASDLLPFAGRIYVFSGGSGERLFRVDGDVPGGQLGFSLADGGDLDGDGIHDILAGAPGGGAGRVLVLSGRDGAELARIRGETAGDFFGAAVGGPGDVDGDGVPDLVVGAVRAAGQAGRAYVISGADHHPLLRLEGAAPFEHLGSGVAGVGDLDGDGRGDFIISARDAGVGQRGLATVYSGATLAPLYPPLAPGPTGGDFGWFFVATPGDVDGDRTPDLYVGDFSDAAGAGRAYVFSGRDGRLVHDFPGAPGDGAGCGRGARDVDGDHRGDILVGAFSSSVGAPGGGKATLYSGCTGAVLRTFTGTAANAQLGFDAVGVGDVNDDREGDLLISSAPADRVYLVAGARTCIADFDRDGDVDRRDLVAVTLALLLQHPRGDTNCDHRVDARDYLTYLGAVLVGCG